MASISIAKNVVNDPDYQDHNPLCQSGVSPTNYSGNPHASCICPLNIDIVHMRTQRTCTLLPNKSEGLGEPGFVACHSASAASPGPFRRENALEEPLFRYLPVLSFR